MTKWQHIIYEELFPVDRWDDIPDSANIIGTSEIAKQVKIKYDFDYIDNTLDQLGNDGWELCATLHMGAPNKHYRKVRYFFKRLVQP